MKLGGFGLQRPATTYQKILDQYVTRGLGLVRFRNVAAGGVAVYTSDICEWSNSIVGTGPTGSGTMSWISHAKSGGWVRATTGAAISSGFQIIFGNVGIYTATQPAWYFAAQMQGPVAVDANSMIACGLQASDNSCSIAVGAGKNVHATDYFLHKDGWYGSAGAGSGLSLGLAKDTTARIFEMWCQPGNDTVYARIDGLAVVSALQSSPPSSKLMAPFLYAINTSGTSTAHHADLDWFVVLSQRG
jgi:hypothetical protein